MKSDDEVEESVPKHWLYLLRQHDGSSSFQSGRDISGSIYAFHAVLHSRS